jgi:uncharacterized protein (TIGR02646 family)
MIALTRPKCPYPKALENGNYHHPVNKSALRESAHRKCMYCESKIGVIDYAHIEHIKPKSKYSEMEFVWENLGYSCAICNDNKGDKYDETLPFINPYDENPENHIMFVGYYAIHKQESERGKITIRELKLNRIELIEERKETFEKIKLMIDALAAVISEKTRERAITSIRQEAAHDKKYSSAVKCFLLEQELFGDAL